MFIWLIEGAFPVRVKALINLIKYWFFQNPAHLCSPFKENKEKLWNAHSNPRREKERISTAFANAWPRPTGAECWPVAERRAARNSRFLTKRLSRRNNFLINGATLSSGEGRVRPRWGLMHNFTFAKQERLSKKKDIEALFAEGKSFTLHPLRILFKSNSDQSVITHQVLFSVPARSFKRAVDRNLIKRRLREAYRLNKSQLTTAIKLHVAYIYIAKEILSFSVVEEKMLQSIQRLKNEIKV